MKEKNHTVAEGALETLGSETDCQQLLTLDQSRSVVVHYNSGLKGKNISLA